MFALTAGNPECYDPFEVIVTVDVTCDCARLQAAFSEQRGYPFDECRLSRSDRPEQVECPDPVCLESAVILIGNTVIDVVNIFFDPDVDVVHV